MDARSFLLGVGAAYFARGIRWALVAWSERTRHRDAHGALFEHLFKRPFVGGRFL